MAETTEARVTNVLTKQHVNKPLARGSQPVTPNRNLVFLACAESSFLYGIFSEQQGLVTMAFCFHNGAFIVLTFGGCKHTLKHVLESRGSFEHTV